MAKSKNNQKSAPLTYGHATSSARSSPNFIQLNSPAHAPQDMAHTPPPNPAGAPPAAPFEAPAHPASASGPPLPRDLNLDPAEVIMSDFIEKAYRMRPEEFQSEESNSELANSEALRSHQSELPPVTFGSEVELLREAYSQLARHIDLTLNNCAAQSMDTSIFSRSFDEMLSTLNENPPNVWCHTCQKHHGSTSDSDDEHRSKPKDQRRFLFDELKRQNEDKERYYQHIVLKEDMHRKKLRAEADRLAKEKADAEALRRRERQEQERQARQAAQKERIDQQRIRSEVFSLIPTPGQIGRILELIDAHSLTLTGFELMEGGVRMPAGTLAGPGKHGHRETMLHLAARHANLEMIDFLLRAAGPEGDAADGGSSQASTGTGSATGSSGTGDSSGPFSHIPITGRPNVSDVDINGHQPLHTAAAAGAMRAVVHLVDNFGALIDARTVDTSATALHLAVGAGHADVVEALLQRGARHLLKDGLRREPLTIARQHLAALDTGSSSKIDPPVADRASLERIIFLLENTNTSGSGGTPQNEGSPSLRGGTPALNVAAPSASGQSDATADEALSEGGALESKADAASGARRPSPSDGAPAAATDKPSPEAGISSVVPVSKTSPSFGPAGPGFPESAGFGRIGGGSPFGAIGRQRDAGVATTLAGSQGGTPSTHDDAGPTHLALPAMLAGTAGGPSDPVAMASPPQVVPVPIMFHQTPSGLFKNSGYLLVSNRKDSLPPMLQTSYFNPLKRRNLDPSVPCILVSSLPEGAFMASLCKWNFQAGSMLHRELVAACSGVDWAARADAATGGGTQSAASGAATTPPPTTTVTPAGRGQPITGGPSAMAGATAGITPAGISSSDFSLGSTPGKRDRQQRLLSVLIFRPLDSPYIQAIATTDWHPLNDELLSSDANGVPGGAGAASSMPSATSTSIYSSRRPRRQTSTPTPAPAPAPAPAVRPRTYRLLWNVVVDLPVGPLISIRIPTNGSAPSEVDPGTEGGSPPPEDRDFKLLPDCLTSTLIPASVVDLVSNLMISRLLLPSPAGISSRESDPLSRLSGSGPASFSTPIDRLSCYYLSAASLHQSSMGR